MVTILIAGSIAYSGEHGTACGIALLEADIDALEFATVARRSFAGPNHKTVNEATGNSRLLQRADIRPTENCASAIRSAEERAAWSLSSLRPAKSHRPGRAREMLIGWDPGPRASERVAPVVRRLSADLVAMLTGRSIFRRGAEVWPWLRIVSVTDSHDSCLTARDGTSRADRDGDAANKREATSDAGRNLSNEETA
jgi:hypothetical protein